jgi:mercuric ion transport protein
MVGAVGLSALTGYLDYVLFPMLGLFLLLTLYAIWHRKKSAPSISKENKNV